MKTLLIVLGGGGHSQQLLPLVEKLEKTHNIEYLIKKDGKPGKKKLRGKVFRIINPRPMDDPNELKTFFRLFPYTIQAIRILSNSKAEAIITCGPAIAIPVAIIGKIFFGKKLIFIESWSRVKSKSLSGKIIEPFADKIFVQWRDNKNYKDAIYAGRLG
jgi:UDP-N-acetylglucosamine:LPS N-acetylglucosamine transferase